MSVTTKCTLIKQSSPGFTHHHDCLEQLRDELTRYICGSCWSNEDGTPKTDDDYGVIDVRDYRCMNIFQQIDTLLSTPCGLEFSVNKTLQQQLQDQRPPYLG